MKRLVDETVLIRLIANAAAFWIFSVPKWGGITRLPEKVARSCRSWAKFTHRCGVATPFGNQPDKHALKDPRPSRADAW